MKIAILFIISLIFLDCGEESKGEPPLIEPGIYNVTATIVEGDWGLQSGYEMEGQFNIHEKDGQYTLSMVGQEWKAIGKVEDNEVVLNHHQNYKDSSEDCDDFKKYIILFFDQMDGIKLKENGIRNFIYVICPNVLFHFRLQSASHMKQAP